MAAESSSAREDRAPILAPHLEGTLVMMRRRGAEHKQPFDQQGTRQHGSDTQDDGGSGLGPALAPAQKVESFRSGYRSDSRSVKIIKTRLQLVWLSSQIRSC